MAFGLNSSGREKKRKNKLSFFLVNYEIKYEGIKGVLILLFGQSARTQRSLWVTTKDHSGLMSMLSVVPRDFLRVSVRALLTWYPRWLSPPGPDGPPAPCWGWTSAASQAWRIICGQLRTQWGHVPRRNTLSQKLCERAPYHRLTAQTKGSQDLIIPLCVIRSKQGPPLFKVKEFY